MSALVRNPEDRFSRIMAHIFCQFGLWFSLQFNYQIEYMYKLEIELDFIAFIDSLT